MNWINGHKTISLLFICLGFLILLRLTSHVVHYEYDSLFNFYRGSLYFFFGIATIVLIPLGLKLKRKLVFLIFYLPFSVVFFIIIVIGSFSFDGNRGVSGIQTEKLRNTKVFVDLFGKRIPFRSGGLAVYQEKHLTGSFYLVEEICRLYHENGSDKYDGRNNDLEFRFKNPHRIECFSKNQNYSEHFELPY